MTTIKPMRASDAIESKLRFPLGIQPKIDGVRGLNLDGTFVGRSLKKHGNKFTTAFYSRPEFIGLDGELAAAHQCDPDLCRITSSLVGRHAGEPFTTWWVFDYLTDMVRSLSYAQRYTALRAKVEELHHAGGSANMCIRLVPMAVVHSLEELLEQEDKWLAEGYEGLIVRDLLGMYKEGYSTVREMGLLRIKRFIEEEAEVLSITEGQTNNNESKINELGRSVRSSHQENMVPNGMVGNMTCRVLKDVYDPTTPGKMVLAKGQIITVARGKMTDAEAAYYFQHPEELIAQIIKFKFFPKGIKDKPRFPNFQAIRGKADL